MYVGDNPLKETVVTYCRYNETVLDTKQTPSFQPELAQISEGETLWVDIDGIQNIAAIEAVGKHFNLHSLVLEDILNTTKRPKFEDFGSYLFIILKVIHPEEGGRSYEQEQISLILGKNFVLSFQEIDHHDAFAGIRERISSARGRIRKMSADYLAYALIDSIVDSYFSVLEALGENLERLEELSIHHATAETLQEIHGAKHQTLLLRRAVWPVREIMNAMVREECPLLCKQTSVFLRDVYDHVVEVIDVLEADRDMAAGLMEIYLSGLSNRMNSVMMVLTVITTIFMPLTFIAGLYGMNFKHMSELEWVYGYPMALGVMLVIAVGMILFFRRRGWI